MILIAPRLDEVFAGNRTVGRLAMTTAAVEGMTRRERVYESGALRVRFPNGESRGPLDAVLVNTAGGMTGGDRFEIDVKAAAGSKLTVTTAAAEKIYRSLGPDTKVDVRFEVGSAGTLAWLPQETILFDQVRLRRSTEVDLARDAKFLLAEAVVFGRSAMGEKVNIGLFNDRRRVRIGGAVVFAETIRLDGQIAQRLEERAVACKGIAVASVLKIPGNDDDVAAIRALAQDFSGEVAASAWNGFVAIRLVAAGGAALRHDLIRVLTVLDWRPPRLWLN